MAPLVRIAVSDVSEMGRNTQGVRLIRLTKGEKLVEIEKIEVLATEEIGGDEDVIEVDGASDSPDSTSEE